MNCIRVGTDNSITVHEWPDSNKYHVIHPFLSGLIGNDCDIVEQVHPRRLYKKYGGPVEAVDPYQKKGMASMLIDESGKLKDNEFNILASWLYGTDMHGSVIVGNVVICGEYFNDEAIGIDFCGLEPEVEADILKALNNVAARLDKGDRERRGVDTE